MNAIIIKLFFPQVQFIVYIRLKWKQYLSFNFLPNKIKHSIAITIALISGLRFLFSYHNNG